MSEETQKICGLCKFYDPNEDNERGHCQIWNSEVNVMYTCPHWKPDKTVIVESER